MRRLPLKLIFTIALLAMLVPSVFAHTTTEVGEYSIITGWQVEPAVVGERNTIYIDVWQDGEMVSYQDMRLNAAFVFDDQRKPIRLVPGSNEGRYTVTYIPTVAGEYSIHLFGTLGDEEVDVEVAPEAVGEATILQFPTSVLGSAELQRGLIAIEDQMASLRMLAIGGIATGVVGILFGLSALRKRPAKADA